MNLSLINNKINSTVLKYTQGLNRKNTAIYRELFTHVIRDETLCFTDLTISNCFHTLRRFSYGDMRPLRNMAENGVTEENRRDRLRYGKQELKTEKIHHTHPTVELLNAVWCCRGLGRRFAHCHHNMGNASLHFL